MKEKDRTVECEKLSFHSKQLDREYVFNKFRNEARKLHDHHLHGTHADDCAYMCADVLADAFNEIRNEAMDLAAFCMEIELDHAGAEKIRELKVYKVV